MKRIVICCDGTWNTPNKRDGDAVAPSNVVKMARAVLLRRRRHNPGRLLRRRRRLARLDAVAHVGRHDRRRPRRGRQRRLPLPRRELRARRPLFFFGFSRGAFTVRSLAGMIRKCGLLDKRHADRALDAYWLYRDRTKDVDGDAALAFRRDFGVAAQIDMRFLGVWDTVGALGIPWRPLAFTHKSTRFPRPAVEYLRRQCLPGAGHRRAPGPVSRRRSRAAGAAPSAVPVPFADLPAPQHVEQAWFAGVHCNVGGGYAECGLSDLTFMWMKGHAEGAGLAFDEGYLADLEARGDLKPNPFGVLRDSRSGFYRLLRPKDRTIADPSLPRSEETVDASAEKRWDGDAAYRPRPLVEYRNRR